MEDGEIKTYLPGIKAPPHRVNPYGWSSESASSTLAKELQTVEMYSHDLNTWLDASHAPLQWRFPKLVDSTPPPSPIKRQSVQQEQERVMLEVIRQRGYEPLELPKKILKTGNKWVRSEIRGLLMQPPHKWTENQFDNTWKRLKKDGAIKEGE